MAHLYVIATPGGIEQFFRDLAEAFFAEIERKCV